VPVFDALFCRLVRPSLFRFAISRWAFRRRAVFTVRAYLPAYCPHLPPRAFFTFALWARVLTYLLSLPLRAIFVAFVTTFTHATHDLPAEPV